jgi:hypothetical protein
MDDYNFSWTDSSNPAYYLINTEVAQGNVLEAGFTVLKNIGKLFLVSFMIGGFFYSFNSRPVNGTLFRVFN